MAAWCTFDVAPSEAEFVPAGKMPALVGEVMGLHLGQGDDKVSVSIGGHRRRVVPFQVHSLPNIYESGVPKNKKHFRAPVIKVYSFPIRIITLPPN
jgi:hypothetical protein